MLKVDEETVRRWVRNGKLKGELNRSKKGGFKIKASDLDEFIQNHPKYQIVELTGSNAEAYALADLDQRIFELEELITKMKFNLEELMEIRNMLKKRE
jgi:predicted site-specific integrase-resolvase